MLRTTLLSVTAVGERPADHSQDDRMTFDLERAGERSDAFDPIVEGGRHHLSADVSLAIWARVRLESTDG